MPQDPIGHSGTTYNGFSGQPVGDPPRPKRGTTGGDRKLLLVGGAGALALALVVGLWARPDFGEDGKAREPMKTAASTGETASPAMPIEIAQDTPAPQPKPTAASRMEVLPADMARAATPAAPVSIRAPQRVIIADPPPAAADYGTPATVVVPPRRMAPQPVAEASYDCGGASTRAEAMVCSDPQLAAADRRLARAYDRAIAAGVSRRDLRDDQRDWLAIREDAARVSPRAVASIYAQRTEELNRIADGAY